MRIGEHIRISSLIKKKVKPKDSAVRVLRVTNLFQEAPVTQFLDNYLLGVHLFFTKSFHRVQVRDSIIAGQLFEDCIGKYSDDYGRRTSSSFKIL